MPSNTQCFLCGKRWTPLQFSLIVLICLVLFNEYFIYVFQTMRWPAMPDVNREDGSSVVILLVADPQIQGYQTEGVWIGPYARWDADSYLKKTFSFAAAHAKPDVVIFLGDLMDEGSRATHDEYRDTYYRFHNIFSNFPSAKRIYIPGDNDVGGEFRDFRTPEKVDRFVKHFEQVDGIVQHKFIDFIKIDTRLQNTEFQEKEQLFRHYRKSVNSPIHVVINHESLLPLQFKSPIYPILSMVSGKLIFSAHWHKPVAYICDDCMRNDDYSWSVHQRDLTHMHGFMFENITRSADCLTEIMVPTCSYRMGEPNMGYGVAVLDAKGGLHYGILWNPNRYRVLYSYLVVTLLVVFVNLILYFCPCLCKCCCGRRTHYYRISIKDGIKTLKKL
ncbi:uncharacterized protein LOC134254673 [Saccostrea cucullata]|uniref:uncharacterized protein LOC134254673 n=1 Tax=Saccostrea cuccullata TaxID=36930 RepID=UPI002ED326B1